RARGRCAALCSRGCRAHHARRYTREANRAAGSLALRALGAHFAPLVEHNPPSIRSLQAPDRAESRDQFAVSIVDWTGTEGEVARARDLDFAGGPGERRPGSGVKPLPGLGHCLLAAPSLRAREKNRLARQECGERREIAVRHRLGESAFSVGNLAFAL